MDFLDPKKQRRHAILLYTGYLFIGIAVVISTIVLVYQANGFGVNSKGQVTQNGLIFVSSQPNPARIYLNGKRDANDQTNTRLSLPAGAYTLKLSRDGYRDWSRKIGVQGGDVQNFDYPFLFPTKLKSEAVASFATAPGVASQSRDRRWLAVQRSTTTTFDLYDLKAKQVNSVPFTIPANLVTKATGSESWTVVQWSNDNVNFLLQHNYGNGVEFLVVNSQDASKSVNLNRSFNSSPASVTLIDNKADQYYLLAADGTLTKANLGSPTPTPVLKNVISYKSYGDKQLAYATAQDAPSGHVNIMFLDDAKTYRLREAAAGTTYLIDIASYSGSQYVVVAASSENVAYIYRDPVGQLQDQSVKLPVALRALRLDGLNQVSFSPNTQFIMAENGGQFNVYDIYAKRPYTYSLSQPFDGSQLHAEWMDGFHLTYVSGGKQLVFDYDGINQQSLMTANQAPGAFFSQDYRYSFAVNPNASGQPQLQRTGLRISSDL